MLRLFCKRCKYHTSNHELLNISGRFATHQNADLNHNLICFSIFLLFDKKYFWVRANSQTTYFNSIIYNEAVAPPRGARGLKLPVPAYPASTTWSRPHAGRVD